MTDSTLAERDRRRGRSPRGIELPSHKTASTQQPLAPAPLPSHVILPLEGGLSARDLRPAVETGQRVLRGQPLVQGGGPLSTWTHASTSGVVRSLERRRIAHPRRREALCAVIEVDGKDERWPELARPDPTHWDTPDKLALALSRAGLAGLGGAVFPTGIKLAAAARHRMRLVIVNGVECEPYISCDDMLMRSSPRDVLAGALVLVELTGARRGVVAIEEDKPEALKALQTVLPTLDAAGRLSIETVPTMYPAGGERQLIQELTGHEVPSLAKPTDIGYLCQNVGTTAALYRYLESGEPVTSRVTTVTGGAVATPRNLEVRLGTRIADLVAACGGYTGKVARLVMGGSMMGVALENDDIPVGRRHQLHRGGQRGGAARGRGASLHLVRELLERMSRVPDAAGAQRRRQARRVRRPRKSRALRLHRVRLLRRRLPEPHPARRDFSRRQAQARAGDGADRARPLARRPRAAAAPASRALGPRARRKRGRGAAGFSSAARSRGRNNRTCEPLAGGYANVKGGRGQCIASETS